MVTYATALNYTGETIVKTKSNIVIPILATTVVVSIISKIHATAILVTLVNFVRYVFDFAPSNTFTEVFCHVTVRFPDNCNHRGWEENNLLIKKDHMETDFLNQYFSLR